VVKQRIGVISDTHGLLWPEAVRERKGVLFVNPGSAGPRQFHLPVSLAFLHVQGASVEAETLILDV
jgi:predicted phosphodiesterase